MQEIAISTEKINLDQFLKWAGLVETGGQVKLLIEDGLIYLNGIAVAERRKKIHSGDVVEIKGMGVWKVIQE